MNSVVEASFILDTEYSADSVEFCPIVNYQSYLVIGTYQLQDSKRIGRIILLQDTGKVLHQLETDAILDMKWSFQTWNGLPILGCVTAQGTTIMYTIKQEQLIEITNFQTSDSLCLSLDWQNRLGGPHRLITSCSNGSIQLLEFNNEVSLQREFHAHGFEAWIASFDYYDINRVYTGGDDCLFKIWDLRTQSSITNKVHEAGVTTISSHPLKRDIFATGSYDEQVRIWDVRQLQQPLATKQVGGGIWRLKWHPKDEHVFLAACMYNGFHVFQYSNSIQHTHEYKKHESIAYGADWSYKTMGLVGTCSFYDHLFTLWNI